jgi:hypothetical protein
VLALDDPAAAVRIGGLHISAEVSPATHAKSVSAAIASHQVSDGEFELLMGQCVELRDAVPQGALLDSFPFHALSVLLPPSAAGQRCE